MGKNLSDMSLEELWHLFPIYLSEHKSCWKDWYNEEKAFLQTLLPQVSAFHHVGSTAIDGISAKPIIDILIVVNSISEPEEVAETLEKHGYIVMSSSENRISLNKGYTENGYAERVFHLHVRLNGDVDEIYFRDYLNAHPDVAKEYEELKLRLALKFEHNRDAYTDGKTEFVKKYTALAKSEAV